MEGLMPLKDEGWMILTRRIMYLFFGLAALNEIVWRTMSTETWVYFKTFGLTAAVFLFFITQANLFQTYGIEDDEAEN
jgi:intracellular septation protein